LLTTSRAEVPKTGCSSSPSLQARFFSGENLLVPLSLSQITIFFSPRRNTASYGIRRLLTSFLIAFSAVHADPLSPPCVNLYIFLPSFCVFSSSGIKTLAWALLPPPLISIFVSLFSPQREGFFIYGVPFRGSSTCFPWFFSLPGRTPCAQIFSLANSFLSPPKAAFPHRRPPVKLQMSSPLSHRVSFPFLKS